MFIRTNNGSILNINKIEFITINRDIPARVEVYPKGDKNPTIIFSGEHDVCRKVLDFIWQQIKLNRKTADVKRFVRRMENKNKLQLSKEELQREKDIAMLEQIVNSTIKNLKS